MPIADHIKEIALKPDQLIALEKLDTFLKDDSHIFFLKGYAGTGKTTLLKGLTKYLGSGKKPFMVMAPTGRAAKILREKTGFGSTVHRGIYNFDELITINIEKEDDAELSFEYMFPINALKERTVIIVDEASMVQAKFHKNELFTFGTNIMLDDLLTFAALRSTGSKLIFVGDPAQLPPYGESNSMALDPSYFQSLDYKCEEATITTVNRQEENLILKNATTIRNVLESDKKTELKMKYDDHSYCKILPEEVFEKYTDIYPAPKVGNGIIINFSNAQCYHNNVAIREKLFPGQKEICPGDIIIIGNNNYQTFGVEIFNGDMAQVIEVGQTYSPDPVPVYCEIAGKRKKAYVNYIFRDLVVLFPHYGFDVPITIIESLLKSTERDLSVCEMKGLFIEFKIRFDKEQKKRRELGLTTFKAGSEEFKNQLKGDKFYNALRAKYGYSVTCHKAQGGEWDTVFVDYSGRISLRDDPLRWCYTATTRGVKRLFALNAPNFGKFDQFKISSLTVVGKIPAHALNLKNIKTSPFHTDNSHKAKSLKYWEIIDKLSGTQYKIEKVESLGGFQERYTLTDGEKTFQMDAFHKGSGHFTAPFKVISNMGDEEKARIEQIINSPYKSEFSVEYFPQAESLKELYSVMQAECDDLGITITNIEGEKYSVLYSLITDNPYAAVLFCFDKDQKLSTAMPRTFGSANDVKLNQLTQNLLEYAGK